MKTTHRQKILRLLIQRQAECEDGRATIPFVTAEELIEIDHRFSARIFELRRKGFDILTQKYTKSGKPLYSLRTPRIDIDIENECVTKNSQ